MGLLGLGRLGTGACAELVELCLVLLECDGGRDGVGDGDEAREEDAGRQQRLLLHDGLEHGRLVGTRDVVGDKGLGRGHRLGSLCQRLWRGLLAACSHVAAQQDTRGSVMMTTSG